MIKYYYNKSYKFIYRVDEEEDSIQYRDSSGNWSTRNQVFTPLSRLKLITKEEANRICRKWHKEKPFSKTLRILRKSF